MPLIDRSQLVRRFDDVARRLGATVAFSRLLADLDRDDDGARRLADEAQTLLAQLEEEHRALERFAGRQALRRVNEAEIGCDALYARLADRNRALSTASLRQELRRRSGGAPHDLVDLVGFFVHLDRTSPWDADRVDKVDLLVTQLSQRLGESEPGPGGERLNQILAASHPIDHPEITLFDRQTLERNLETIAAEVQAADSLGQLIGGGTLSRYRELKHRLGRLLLHPELLVAVVETNHGLRSKIQRLNSRTMTGIFSTYQGIFEVGLKGGIDDSLRREIEQLNLEFDRFERRVKQDDLRLTELEEFWATLRSFSERLEEATTEEPTAPTPEPPPSRLSEEPSEAWLSDDLVALLDLLRESDRKGWPAEFISFSPREAFQIDPRELQAFRRLDSDEAADRQLETFLLKAAALRRTIKRSARELAGISDAETLREQPVFATARQAVQLAESFLARYSQAVEQAVLGGDVEEAQRLQILRMRLVRESAGIWLQVYQ